jgi:hypothetical protein
MRDGPRRGGPCRSSDASCQPGPPDESSCPSTSYCTGVGGSSAAAGSSCAGTRPVNCRHSLAWQRRPAWLWPAVVPLLLAVLAALPSRSAADSAVLSKAVLGDMPPWMLNRTMDKVRRPPALARRPRLLPCRRPLGGQGSVLALAWLDRHIAAAPLLDIGYRAAPSTPQPLSGSHSRLPPSARGAKPPSLHHPPSRSALPPLRWAAGTRLQQSRPLLQARTYE